MQFSPFTQAEALPMSQELNPMSKLTDHPVAKTVSSHTLPLIRAAVLAVSVAAAIPTAHNLYYSWSHGIPYSQVPHRLAQYDLWMKNLECKIDYRQLLTTSGTKVDVGACTKSGDIAIKVSSDKGHASYEWIAYDQLQKPSLASLFGLLVTPAVAEEAYAVAKGQSTPGIIKVAEGSIDVKCQTRQGNEKLVRVTQEGAKCYREVMSLLKGSVDERKEVPCSTQCK
jgi:hypothetical protein